LSCPIKQKRVCEQRMIEAGAAERERERERENKIYDKIVLST